MAGIEGIASVQHVLAGYHLGQIIRIDGPVLLPLGEKDEIRARCRLFGVARVAQIWPYWPSFGAMPQDPSR